MIVYNADPYGYSENAKKHWIQKGYMYIAGSWDQIDKGDKFENVVILIVRLARKVDDAVLEKFPNLKQLVSATTGHDHLDVEALNKRKIKLVSLRGHGDFLNTISSTAEHTWALLLALLRNIPAANQDVISGQWQRDTFRGIQLKDKCLGIIGLGRTGNKVANYADAFNMQVLWYDPYKSSERKGKCEKLIDLLEISDIISIHVHLNHETENLLSREYLKLMKQGSYLINTSRGALLNEDTVVEMLISKHLIGVATDVLCHELNDIKESPLWQAQQNGYNIIITPHIGGATWEAMWACEDFIAKLL